MGIGWQVQVAIMLIPTLIYGYLFSKLQFPVTERVASGVSTAEMYKSVGTPLFVFMFICMFGTAITELFTGQWVGVLLNNVTDNAILILTITTGVMVVGRGLAEPIVHRFSPQGVLLISAILAAVGIYMMSTVTGSTLYFAALVFGIGVCYFWPTMLGFVAENIPKSGALGLNLMGGAGMFAVSIYTLFMGGFYDRLIAEKLPEGASMEAYRTAAAGTAEAAKYAEAQLTAGPDVLKATAIIPVILTIAFAGLVFYMRNKKETTIGSSLMVMKKGNSRRTALKQMLAAGAGIALAPAVGLAAEEKAASTTMKGNINHSVCRWTYGHLSLDQLCIVAKEIELKPLTWWGQKSGRS